MYRLIYIQSTYNLAINFSLFLSIGGGRKSAREIESHKEFMFVRFYSNNVVNFKLVEDGNKMQRSRWKIAYLLLIAERKIGNAEKKLKNGKIKAATN